MSRRAVGFDRVATFVAGLCLLASGCCGIAWQQGAFGADASLQLMVARYVEMPWWPWALGAAGVTLVVLGGRWIATHRWAPKASRVVLAADESGLTADATSVADAAATFLEEQSGVLKARGTATIDRGAPTVTLTMTVPARRGLRSGVEAADRAVTTAGVMLGGSVALRTVLRVDAKHGPAVR
jgi:hypothetical protein